MAGPPRLYAKRPTARQLALVRASLRAGQTFGQIRDAVGVAYSVVLAQAHALGMSTQTPETRSAKKRRPPKPIDSEALREAVGAGSARSLDRRTCTACSKRGALRSMGSAPDESKIRYHCARCGAIEDRDRAPKI